MWASDPYPGSMHDVVALDASGLLDGRPLRVDHQQGRLFSGRLRAFLGNGIMMVRPHEVQWSTKTTSTTS